jgi:hypothetical protein
VSVRWENTLTPALAKLKERLAAGEHMVKVGLPDDPKVGHDGVSIGLTLGETALINEFGSDDGRVPERPAFRLGLAHGQDDFNRLNRVNLRRVASGTMTLDQALGQLGEMGVARVKTEILDGDFEPNAPSTIARKGSSHPLIDTAQEKQSVTWEVVG